jgi:release factor glutamine methyltransferase
MLRPKRREQEARRGDPPQEASGSPAADAWTIKRLLEWVTPYLTDRKVDSPRLSAELLLSHVLAKKRIELYTQFDAVVDKPALERLRDLVRRAGQHEPVAYLVGKTEFYSLEMRVCPDCLIPRPETELLVQKAIEFLRARPGPYRVLDLCTGSGCIAVALAVNCKDARIVATDVCDKALAAAAQNVDRYGLQDRVKLLSGDLFDPIVPQMDEGPFDLIVCNPPYVTAAEYDKLDRNVKEYEPQRALLAGDDGLDVLRRVIQQADPFLNPAGALMLEIGYQQASAVTDLIRQATKFQDPVVHRDFQGHDRVVVARKG